MNLALLLSTTPIAAHDEIIDRLRRRVTAYSEDEPRDDHGRWSKEGDQLSLTPDSKKAHVAAVTQAVQDVAKRLGFPLNKIIIETEKESRVEVDGVSGAASGQYDNIEHTITIYPKEISDAEEAKTVMAHETQHHIFNMVMDKVFDKLNDDAAPQAAYSKLITLLRNPLRLAEEDGVTPYSRIYWDGVLNHTVPMSLAVNETLGEIANLDERNHGPVTQSVNDDWGKAVGQRWRGLYNAFKDAYATLPKTRTKKIAAAVKQGVVDGKIAFIAPYSPHLLRVLFVDGGSAFVARTPDMRAYSEVEPRDKDGKWTTGGESEIFVSPNLTENLAIKDAIRFLSSDRQTRFEAKARDVVAEVAGGGKVEGAIGVWADGAENSTAITLPHAEADVLRYTASLLGKSGDQKAVLAWQNAANGPHALYTLSTGLEPTQIAADSLKLGIAFQTIVPGDHGGRIQILDQDGSLADKVEALGSLPGYTPVGVQRGSGEFIGSWTSREEGIAAYDKVIQDYEKAHQGYKGSLEFSGADGNKGWSDLYRRIEAAKINTICRCGHTLAQHPSPPDFGCKFCGEEQCPGFLQLRAYSPDEARDENGKWSSGGSTPKGVQTVYRGSRGSGRSFPDAVFVSLSKEAASQYGDVKSYKVDFDSQKLLNVNSPAAKQIVNEFLQDKLTSDDFDDEGVPLFMFPDKQWVAFVQQRGYTGTQIGNEFALFTSLSDLKAYSPDEARDKNGEWTDGGQRDRSADAKRTYNPATLEKQHIADEAEMRLSKAVGLPRTRNNSAFDLVGKGVAVEVKTLVDRKRDEITMHPKSLQRKQKEARKTKANAYTVVLDERPGKQQVYWKAGVGSFTLNTMNRATSVQALRKVLVPR